MASTAFTSSGEDVIHTHLDVVPDTTASARSDLDLITYYEIEETAEEILKRDFKRITLQFPDELLHDSVPVFKALKKRLGPGRDVYVLADTSYGSCCVDEVAATHVDADVVVHYGHACMSVTSRIPALYVFGHQPVDGDHAVESLLEKCRPSPPHAILLMYDVAFSHNIGKIHGLLQEKLGSDIPVLVQLFDRYQPPHSKEPPPTVIEAGSTTGASSSHIPASRGKYPTAPDGLKSTIFYIGGESLGLNNILMTHSECEVYSYDPRSRVVTLQSGRTNRLLMRRYAVAQKARDADVFGILVGTLGVASYLPLISHLRTVLARAQKKTYTVSVGKLNPAKLANFLEIECWVLIACPENSVIEAKDFLRPIITPFELDLVLGEGELSWSGRFVLDFEQVISESRELHEREAQHRSSGAQITEDDDDGERPIFSHVTGKYRHAKRYGGDLHPPSEAPSSAVVLRNGDGSLTKVEDGQGLSLSNRTFQGLEQRTGQDAPSLLEQGRSGIAKGYSDDHPREG